MKGIVVFFFCFVSGVSLGVLTGIGMAPSYATDIAALTGGGVGAIYGTIGSVPFLWQRNHPNIFAILVLCFIFAVPVAIVSGYTRNPTLAAVLITATILAIFFLSIRKGSNDEKRLLETKSIYIAALICVTIAGIAAYHYAPDYLPNDIGSLTEMMGSNDQAIHLAAAHKLKRLYGKEPFLSALRNANPRVRDRAAHFLGFFKEPGVQEALISIANDPDPYVRKWVAYSLGQVGDQRAISTLRDLAKDHERMVRTNAEEAISNIEKRTG